MTLLVKDEIDIVESVIRFHREFGVDYLVVTDNNSSDGTREILQALYGEGLIDEVIDEADSDYAQAKWVDRMIRCCIDNGCDWIMNGDADEFWFPKSGSIKNVLRKTHATVLLCPIYNVLPEHDLFYENTWRIERGIDVRKYGMGTYSLYGNSVPKVIHRAKGYVRIHTGNHGVDIFPKILEETADITIFTIVYEERITLFERW